MSPVTRRDFLSTSAALGLAGAGALVLPRRARAAFGPNDTINVGVIGVGGRGAAHIQQIKNVKGVKIVAVCDPDSARTADAAENLPGVKQYADIRKLLEDDDIHAVTIATCNHWHCLAAVWACEAGKDVYVEKPLSYTLWEGRALIKAAEKSGSIVQVGTQQRSDPLQAEVKDFLHEQQALGKIKSVVIARFGVRASIGKREAPLDPPKTVDYNIWLGPSQDEPIFRTNFHYDWHWSWNTGSGECGNWGVHLIDDVVNVVFRDKHKLPDRAAAGGARVVWDDAGESPNLHMAYLEAGGTPVLFALSNLPARPDSQGALKFNDVETGYVVLCEGGEYRGRRGGGIAVDTAGKPIKQFKGDSGAGHIKNFFDAVRAHDPKMPNCNLAQGHSATGWAHMLNATYRSATQSGLNPPEPATHAAGFEELNKIVLDHIAAHGLKDSPAFHTSDLLVIDPASERFTGPGSDSADAANAFLAKPKYREGFEIKGDA